MVVLGAMRCQQFTRMRHIVVPERHNFAARQLRAGEQAGVRQFIRQHQAVGKKLQFPVVLAGPLSADARLTDAGDLTRLDFAAKLGDIKVKVGGTLRALGLPGSDLKLKPLSRMPPAWRRRST